jgi:hypothetical protein
VDPFNLKASLRALAASKRQEPVSVPEEEKNPVRKLGSKIQADIVKEAPPGLLERAGGTALSGLATVGNLLDVPGSMVRDTLSWLPGGPKPQNPFDQLASPFTHENRLTGRDLMRGYGLAGKEDTMLNFLTGLGAEIALDPLSYLTFGASAMTKGGKAARALNLENRAVDTASKALGRKVGKREARHVVTPRMLIEDASNDIRRFDEKELTERFKDFGVDEARLDRPLGGLAKISIPFTDRPFTWNKKPVTFWGLTDEEGIIGGGRIRGRGEPPVDKIKIPDTPPNDKGPSISPSGTGPAGPDVDGPTPPPSGPSPGPSGPAPTTGGPMNPAGGPDLEGPTRNEPVIDPPTPKGGGPIEPIAKITPRGDELDIDIDAGPTGSAKAVVAYSSDAAEDPAILISSFSRMPEASVGTGRAIINKIVEVAKDKNPSSISGKFDNSQALGAFLSVFGKDNVTFYDRATGNPLDISFAEALKSPQSYIATHEFKKPVAETIQEAAPAVDDVVPSASVVDDVAPAPELPPATIQPELAGFEPEVATTPAVAESLPQSTLPPATVQPTLAGFEPEVVKAAKRGRKAKQKPVTEAEAKDAYNTTIAANEIRDEAKAIAKQAARQDAIARWRSKYPTSSKEYLASGDLSKSDYEKALITGVDPQTLKQIIDDGITEGAFSKEQGDNLKSIIDRNTAKPSVAETPAAFNTQPTANVQRGLANFEPEVVKVAKRDRRAKEKPVVETAPVVEQAITAARTVDDALDPARVANAEKTKTANEFVRRLGDIQVDGRPKYGPKELEIVRSVALGNVDGAVSQFKNYKERGLDLELNFSKLGERAKNEKFITEAQLAEYQSKMRDAITDVYLKNYDIMRDTPASIGSRAGVDVWPTLDPNIRSMFSGNKQFGDAMTKRAGFLRDQANKQAQAAAKAAEDAAKKGKLKSEVGAAAGDGLAPRMVNLKSLEGLPEEAKPIVGEMLTKIGQKLFDDVKLQVGGDGAKATVAGDIDMNTGFINIYNAAIKNKTVDKTTIHELWHHLSKYVSPDEVRLVRNEFEQAVAAFKKSEGNKALPYELSSVDEFFAHKVTDLSMKYLGREKPVDLIGKVWTKALEAFEYIWDAIRQTLGYDQTKKIMSSFLNGHRSEISKYTDATMTQRLMDELDPGASGVFDPPVIKNLDARIDFTSVGQTKNSDYISTISDDAAREALKNEIIKSTNRSQKETFGVHRPGGDFEIKNGANVAFRIDIPVFNKTKAQTGKGDFVVTIHKDSGGTSDQVDSVLSYDSIARMSGPVRFSSVEKGAIQIADGKNKFPIATVKGKFDPSREIPRDLDDNWVPIGFNPEKAVFFYDKRTGQEVTNGVDALSVGNTVFTRQPTYGQRSAADSSQAYQAIPKKERLAQKSESLLESQADPFLSTPEIAEQLSKFRSAKIAKGIDQIGERILDTAPARQLTALFDQSVLGQLTKAGQEIARMAFTAYRESVLRERKFMSDHVRTWYDTPNIREDVIIQEELPSLANYTTAANGDKKLAAKRQLVDARKIQNERVNDIRRIMERSIFDSEGKVRQNAHVVTPEMLPAWVGREKIDGRIIENPERRIQLSRMLTAFRQKIANMIRDEHGAGVNTSWLDGYYPRISPNLPGSNFSLWNPNYGKILDPTHPNQKRRKDFFVGYSDGTSVVNDISVDPDFSGVHARKKVREDLQDKEVYEYAKKLWNKYRDRLFPDKISMSFEQMLATDKIAGKKITELTRAVMELDPRHAEFQIPMFSNDLFSAFELRLEHHHRSIMQANVIRNLIKRDIAPRDLLESKKAVTLDKVLRESKYDNQKAIPLVMNSIPGSVMLQVDQRFWAKEIQNRVDKAKQLYDEAMRQIEQGVASPSTAYVDPGGKSATFDPSNSTIRIKNFFDSGKEDSDLYDLTIRVNFRDPNKSVAELVRWTVVDDEIIETPPVVLRNPLNLTPDQVGKYYKSDLPPKYLLNELVIPDDIASAVTKFVKGPRVLEEMGPIVRGYDKATNMWKMMQTGMMPFISFHGRNLGSGQASNFYLGIQNDPRFQEFNFADPKTWLNPIRKFTAPIADAHRLQTGQEIKDISKAPAFKGLGYTDEQATERLRRMAYAQGITGEKQGLSAEQLMDTVGTAASQYPGLDPKRGVNPLAWKWSEAAPESTFAQRWLMPWMSKGVLSDADVFRPGQLGRDLGSYTEGLNRLAPFIAMIRQGYDPRAAANAINRAQVDYTNLSNFNREYTRRLFPFATYTLGMAPTVFGELMQRPGGGMARTIMATTQAGQTDEQGVTPDYIRETASIPLGVSDDGTRSYITGFGLPFEDPLQFAQAARGNVSGLLREVGSRMNPIPKSLIETMTGRSLYQAGPFGGREIEDLDPTIGRIAANVSDLITGEKTERAQPFISPWTEYAISNAGPGRMLNTIRTATDPRKWDVIPWKLMLNLGTGVRVADVSPSAQDAILRERIAKIMKDFGGRMYTRPYFPDYAKENWSPEEARDALEIDALMKLLNKRASDRKKMEE